MLYVKKNVLPHIVWPPINSAWLKPVLPRTSLRRLDLKQNNHLEEIVKVVGGSVEEDEETALLLDQAERCQLFVGQLPRRLTKSQIFITPAKQAQKIVQNHKTKNPN